MGRGNAFYRGGKKTKSRWRTGNLEHPAIPLAGADLRCPLVLGGNYIHRAFLGTLQIGKRAILAVR